MGERGRELFVLAIAVRQGRQRRDAFAAGEDRLGRCAAEQSKYYRLHLQRGKVVALAAMYLRRFRVAGRSFAAARTHVSTVITPPAPAT